METRIERKYCLRTSDFDRFRRIRPAAVMDLFQDVAGVHANMLGCGYNDLIESKLMWVLVRVKFTVEKQPEMFSEVAVQTWPLEPSRAGFRREYLMTDAEGNTLIRGSSDWVIMHSEERKLVSVKDLYPIKDGFCTEVMHPERLAKIRDFEAESEGFSVNPEFSDIDMNGHVNNIKYMDFVFDAVSPEKSLDIISAQIDYRKEILPGTKLNIYTQKTDDGILAKGTDLDGNTMFLCKIEL